MIVFINMLLKLVGEQFGGLYLKKACNSFPLTVDVCWIPKVVIIDETELLVE